MPPTIISDFQELQRKNYNNVTFRARLIFVNTNIDMDPNMTSTSTRISFHVIVSDANMSMKGTFWSWGEDTFDFLLANVQNIFEFNGTGLKVIKDERFATEHFLQFSCDKQDRFRSGYSGDFRVIPQCKLPFKTCIVRTSVHVATTRSCPRPLQR